MIQISLKDAQEQLPELLVAAQRGEEVLIVSDNATEPNLYRLTAVGATRARKAGSAKGRIIIHDNFDDPLPDFDEYQ